MMSFTVAHAAVIRLRLAEPDRERPYRGPGTLRIAGRELPGFAVFGGASTALSFLVVTTLHPVVAIVGTVWLALGLTIYAFYRRRHGLDLVTTAKIVVPQPVTATEAEYRSVLVALEVDHFAPQILATAAKLAARGGRGIYVIVTITVPQSSPLDAELPEREAAAASVIEHARLLVGRRVAGRVIKIRAGQGGRVIIDEARMIRSQAIVLPLPPRTGTTLFGKTVETVLAERPCRVIIESEPSRA
jgi:APA family basic amino acid/polyamine antiporter